MKYNKQWLQIPLENAVTHGDFPHQAFLITKGNKIFCSASIIHPKFLLTAARCFEHRLLYLRIVAGAHNLRESDQNREQTRALRHMVIPGNFNNETFENDIALLELYEALNFDGKYVNSVELWNSSWPLPGEKS